MHEPLHDDRMPIASRPARLLAAACLVVATLLASLPSPVAALEPPKPLPGYRPDFVTETDTRPWTDCLWASAAMLLDKWTNGDVQVTRQALRTKSGDRHGGSTFDDMKVAFAKYGFKLRFSPDGGERITWGQMLSRLGRGAGAVLLGDDHKLPRHFGRWDYGFWKKTGKGDNHAVYIERYDRRRGRVWLMDPLGRGDWKGEWISTRALRKFAWRRGGAIYVAMTPVAKAAPFHRVRATSPKVVLSSTAVDASWALKAPRRWRFPGADVKAEFRTPADVLLAAAKSQALPVKAVASEPANGAKAVMAGRTLHVTAPLPTAPGAYVASLAMRDRRFGRVVVHAEDVAVFVPGDRRAQMRLNVHDTSVQAGAGVKLSLNVANTGTETWADTRSSTAEGQGEAIPRGTRVEARWIPLALDPVDGGAADDTEDATTLAPTMLELVPLAPGKMLRVRDTLVAPDQTGQWALVIDVVDDVDGSYAALGSAPAVMVFDVVSSRGIVPIN